MKLLVQKVTRASVEVDGLIESRIGTGMVLNLAVTTGSTVEDARKLAEKVIKLKLWPDLADQDVPCKSSVVDNGYEILVVLQPSLCSVFPRFEPREQGVVAAKEAKAIVEAFAKYLQTEYQEEMIATAPTEGPVQVETVCQSPCLFELDSSSLGAPVKTAVTKAAVVKTQEPSLVELEPEVPMVTKALRQLPLHSKTRATLESCRVFRVLSMRKFRAALSEAVQAESDAFAEALEGAAKYFSAKQLDQIMSWTGLTIVAPPRDDEVAAKEEEDEGADEGVAQDDLGGGNLDEQLAQLQEEVDNPEAARKRKRVQAAQAAKEQAEAAADAAVARRRPDWKGRAAPETPAAASARQWAQNRAGLRQQWNQPGGLKGGKGGKGWGKSSGPRPWRSLGIASLDTASHLHGNSAGGYEYRQLRSESDRENKFLMKEEGAEYDEGEDEEKPAKKRGLAAPPRRPKGTPTLAPMTPAPGEVKEDL